MRIPSLAVLLAARPPRHVTAAVPAATRGDRVAGRPGRAVPLPSAEFALGYRRGRGGRRARDRARAGSAARQARARRATMPAWPRPSSSASARPPTRRYAAYAEDALMAAEARDPRDPEVMTASILRLHNQHRFAPARATRRARLIEAAPDRSIGLLLLGDALLELGDYAAATDAYQQRDRPAAGPALLQPRRPRPLAARRR